MSSGSHLHLYVAKIRCCFADLGMLHSELKSKRLQKTRGSPVSVGLWLVQVSDLSLPFNSNLLVLLLSSSVVLHEQNQHFKAGQAPAHIHYESFINVFCKI